MNTAEGTVVPIRPPEEPKSRILTRQFTTLFAAALVRAQMQIQRIGKDGFNSFHKYAYTTGDSMIEAAREALNANGLACMNTGWYRDGDRITVQYVVLHESGEHLDAETTSTVIPEKGRPEDKAEFGALTENAAYFLRGLLLIPRGNDEDTPSARDDRQRNDRQQQRRQEPTPAPVVDAEAERRLAAVLTDKEVASRFDQLNASPQRRRKTVESYGLDKAKVIAALDQAIAKKQQPPADPKPKEPAPAAAPAPAEQKAQPAPAAAQPKPPQQKPPPRPPVNPDDIPF